MNKGHRFGIVSESSDGARYRCSSCGFEIGFAKAGNGSPVVPDPAPVPLPVDLDPYYDPCS